MVAGTGRPRVIIVGAGFGGITAARAVAGCEVDIASSLFGVGGNDRSCLSTDVFWFG